MYHNIFLSIIISTIHHLFLNCDLNVNPVPMKHDAQGTAIWFEISGDPGDILVYVKKAKKGWEPLF